VLPSVGVGHSSSSPISGLDEKVAHARDERNHLSFRRTTFVRAILRSPDTDKLMRGLPDGQASQHTVDRRPRSLLSAARVFRIGIDNLTPLLAGLGRRWSSLSAYHCRLPAALVGFVNSRILDSAAGWNSRFLSHRRSPLWLFNRRSRIGRL
jgi:hypothetical protein